MSKLCRVLLIMSLLAVAFSALIVLRATWPCSLFVLIVLLITAGRRGYAYVRDAYGSARFALDEELRRRGMIDE